jgi:peptide/nickel transport system substrate-binding protein
MFKFSAGSRAARRARWAAAIPIVTALFAGACTSSPSTTTDGVSDTLTFAVSGAPTLDPYKANVDPNSAPNINLAYSGLIRLNADGSYTGDLAESFGYTDNENKNFQVKLRAGVKFADGTPVDAAAVVASLNYFLKEGLNAASFGGSIDTITAVDSSTVLITNKTSNPVMPMLLSQALLAGSIISPAGLADTSKLAQQTFGAGPYVLDPTNTVPNDHYTYTANPNYWNKDLQHWKKIVVKVIADSNATVQAIQANQVDSAMVLGESGDAVVAAGLRHKEDNAVLIGMILADRDGAVAPELKDIRVRQALNYAIDRAAVTKAVLSA